MKNSSEFNGIWIADLLKKQYTDKVEISKKIMSLKEGIWESKAYIYFVSKENLISLVLSGNIKNL
jgi:hypothetical protein